jgi:hypothetical protein
MQVTQLVAGDTFNPPATVTPAYPASAGWVLRYRLRPRTPGVPEILLTCAAAGDDHQPSAPASLTAQWVPGAYSWASWVERAGESYTLEQGQITILPDPRTAAAGVDGRSHDQRMVDLLRALIEGRAGTDAAEVEIAGRRVKKMAPGELMKWLSVYEQRLATAEAQARLAAGLGGGRRIQVALR